MLKADVRFGEIGSDPNLWKKKQAKGMSVQTYLTVVATALQ